MARGDCNAPPKHPPGRRRRTLADTAGGLRATAAVGACSSSRGGGGVCRRHAVLTSDDRGGRAGLRSNDLGCVDLPWGWDVADADQGRAGGELVHQASLPRLIVHSHPGAILQMQPQPPASQHHGGTHAVTWSWVFTTSLRCTRVQTFQPAAPASRDGQAHCLGPEYRFSTCTMAFPAQLGGPNLPCSGGQRSSAMHACKSAGPCGGGSGAWGVVSQ